MGELVSKIASSFVAEGLAELAPGPRGGAGWSLTQKGKDLIDRADVAVSVQDASMMGSRNPWPPIPASFWVGTEETRSGTAIWLSRWIVAKAHHPHSGRFCLQLERNHVQCLAQTLAGKLWSTLVADAFSLLFIKVFKFSAIHFLPWSWDREAKPETIYKNQQSKQDSVMIRAEMGAADLASLVMATPEGEALFDLGMKYASGRTGAADL
jgi:hypothetical protein